MTPLARSVAPPMSVVPPPVTAPVAIPVRMGTVPAAPRPALLAAATVCRRVGAVRPRRVNMPKAARPGMDPTKPVLWFVICKLHAPPPIPVPTPRVRSVGHVVNVLRIVVGVGEGVVVQMLQQPSPTFSPQVQLPRAFILSPGEPPPLPPATIWPWTTPLLIPGRVINRATTVYLVISVLPLPPTLMPRSTLRTAITISCGCLLLTVAVGAA